MRIRAIVMITALVAGMVPGVATAAPAEVTEEQVAPYVWENPRSPNARAFTRAATDQIGRSYCWGGGDLNGPTLGYESGCDPILTGPGFDCSGLVHYALGQAEVRLGDRDAADFSELFVEVKGEPQPGDLIFYDRQPLGAPDGHIEHVAIFLGRDLTDKMKRNWVVEAYGDKWYHAPDYRVQARPYVDGEGVLIKRPFALTPPPALTVRPLAEGNVSVEWTDPYSTESGFVLASGLNQIRLDRNVTSTTWTAPASTHICFIIRGFIRSPIPPHYDQESSDWSTPVCTYTSPPPAAPTNIDAVADNSNTIRVTWTDNSSNELGFEVATGTNVIRFGPNTTSYTLHGLDPGTRKCFMVRSYHGGGASPWSPWDCVTTPTAGPAVPSHVTVSNIGDTVRVNWRDNSADETGFYIQRRRGTEVIVAGAIPANYEEAFFPGSPTDTTLCWAVASYNANGQSPWTPEVCIAM